MKSNGDTEVTFSIDDADENFATEINELDRPAPAPNETRSQGGSTSFWEQRGYPEGCPEEDWYRAERELAER
jgi:hypothetical protein